jgi:hypothetical protein
MDVSSIRQLLLADLSFFPQRPDLLTKLNQYKVAPLNGTFSGTLTGTGQGQITFQVTQDSNFGITASGTSVQAGVTTNLSISPSDGSTTNNSSPTSNVIGATLQASGAATKR